MSRRGAGDACRWCCKAQQLALAAAALGGGSGSSGAVAAKVFLDTSRARYEEPGSLFMPPPRNTLAVSDLVVPTERPLDVPVLDPWRDRQPLDTWIGKQVVSPLLPRPTDEPPPTQLSIRLASGCPLMQEWPSKVLIDAPDPCVSEGVWGKYFGNWTAAAEDSDGTKHSLLRWEEVCDLSSFSSNFEPIVTYTVPQGDLFGTSQTLTTVFGTTMELRDCVSHPLFVITEKVLDNAGIIWIQYFIRNESNHLLAETSKFHPFANEFVVVDASGVLVAEVVREGDWQPTECNPDQPIRRWRISYSEGIGHTAFFSDPLEQWPVSQMVTMMSLRDIHRRANGLASPPSCHQVKVVSYTLLIALALSCCGCTLVLFLQVGLRPMQAFMWNIQSSFCPPRFRVASKHRSGGFH